MQVDSHSLNTAGIVLIFAYQVFVQWYGKRQAMDQGRKEGRRDEQVGTLSLSVVELKAEFDKKVANSDRVIENIFTKINSMDKKLAVLCSGFKNDRQ